jgi:hypothetical protein
VYRSLLHATDCDKRAGRLHVTFSQSNRHSNKPPDEDDDECFSHRHQPALSPLSAPRRMHGGTVLPLYFYSVCLYKKEELRLR